EIQTLEIVQPQLTLVQEPDGSLNLLNLLSSGQPSAPTEEGATLPIVIENLYIRDGHLRLHLPTLPGGQQLEGLELRLTAPLDVAGVGLRVQQVTAHTSPADVDIRTLQGAVQIRGGVVQIDDLRLQTGQTSIMVNGALPGGAEATRLTLQMQPLDLTEA